MEVNDNELRTLVEERLREDPTIDAEDIEIRIHDGLVSLHGHVESRDDRKWVEALVRQIPEVKDVMNNLFLGNMGRKEDWDLFHDTP